MKEYPSQAKVVKMDGTMDLAGNICMFKELPWIDGFFGCMQRYPAITGEENDILQQGIKGLAKVRPGSLSEKVYDILEWAGVPVYEKLLERYHNHLIGLQRNHRELAASLSEYVDNILGEQASSQPNLNASDANPTLQGLISRARQKADAYSGMLSDKQAVASVYADKILALNMEMKFIGGSCLADKQAQMDLLGASAESVKRGLMIADAECHKISYCVHSLNAMADSLEQRKAYIGGTIATAAQLQQDMQTMGNIIQGYLARRHDERQSGRHLALQ